MKFGFDLRRLTAQHTNDFAASDDFGSNVFLSGAFSGKRSRISYWASLS